MLTEIEKILNDYATTIKAAMPSSVAKLIEVEMFRSL